MKNIIFLSKGLMMAQMPTTCCCQETDKHCVVCASDHIYTCDLVTPTAIYLSI